jgi:hypothetical protein
VACGAQPRPKIRFLAVFYLAVVALPPGGVVLFAKAGRIMIDPNSRHARELKAAEEFFTLARTAFSPFMRAYYQRVAERYLSSQGELKSFKTPENVGP